MPGSGCRLAYENWSENASADLVLDVKSHMKALIISILVRHVCVPGGNKLRIVLEHCRVFCEPLAELSAQR